MPPAGPAPLRRRRRHDSAGPSAPLVHRHPRGGDRQRPAPLRPAPALLRRSAAPPAEPAAVRDRRRPGLAAAPAGARRRRRPSSSCVPPQVVWLLGGATFGADAPLHRPAAAAAAPRPTTQAYIQFFGDLVLITGLVYFLGGAASPFSLLYLIVIAVASTLLRRRAGVIVASAAFLLYGGMIVALFYALPSAGDPGGQEAISGVAAGLQPRRPRLRLLRRGAAHLLPGAQRHPRRARPGREERAPGRPPGGAPRRHPVDHQRPAHHRPRRDRHQRQPRRPGDPRPRARPSWWALPIHQSGLFTARALERG